MKARKSIYRSEKGKAEVLSFYSEILKQWVSPSLEYTINTSFGNTFIIESGCEIAPVIILLHGTGSNSAMWIADAARLSVSYHVFAIDIIGECGKSDENRPAFSDRNYAIWLNEIFHSLHIEKATLIACSLGGWIALDFSIQFPQKTEKLILISTAGITQVNLKTIILIMLSSLFGKWGFNKINKMVYGGLEIDEKALEFASLVKKHFIPRKDLLPVFPDEDIEKVLYPLLFIGGDQDCFYNSKKTASRLSSLCPNSRSIIVEGSGHVVVDQAEIILKFIEN